MSNELDLLKKMALNFIISPPPSYVLQGFEGIKKWNEKHGIVFGSRFSVNGNAKGFNDEGRDAIIELIRILREETPHYLNSMSEDKFCNLLIDILIKILEKRKNKTLTSTDLDELKTALHSQVDENTVDHRFFIPCLIIPRTANDFTVGPVTFGHIDHFDLSKHTDITEIESSTMNLFHKFMNERHAQWIAIVDTKNFDTDFSEENANLAVDVALIALQLIFPTNEVRHMSRATGRISPASLVAIYKKGNSFRTSSSNREPGLSFSGEYFEQTLSLGRGLLKSVGNRVDGYLNGTAKFPKLNQSWCDAAFWYHEGIAEPIDTVAIAKLETSVEALVRAESIRGSSKRFRQCFKVFYGWDEKHKLNNGMEVKDLVKLLVGRRSQVLHGTLPTISRNNIEMNDRSVRIALENSVSVFLKKFTEYLDHYENYVGAEDNNDRFLECIERSDVNLPLCLTKPEGQA